MSGTTQEMGKKKSKKNIKKTHEFSKRRGTPVKEWRKEYKGEGEKRKSTWMSKVSLR